MIHCSIVCLFCARAYIHKTQVCVFLLPGFSRGPSRGRSPPEVAASRYQRSPLKPFFTAARGWAACVDKLSCSDSWTLDKSLEPTHYCEPSPQLERWCNNFWGEKLEEKEVGEEGCGRNFFQTPPLYGISRVVKHKQSTCCSSSSFFQSFLVSSSASMTRGEAVPLYGCSTFSSCSRSSESWLRCSLLAFFVCYVVPLPFWTVATWLESVGSINVFRFLVMVLGPAVYNMGHKIRSEHI